MSTRRSRTTKSASPPVSRPLTPLKPSLALKLLATALSLSPFLFESRHLELLHPLFSQAPTHSSEAAGPFYAVLVVVFLFQRFVLKQTWSWRSYWLVIGIWKIAMEGIVRKSSEWLLGFGLDEGIVVARLLVEGVAKLAMWNWIADSFECKERVVFLSKWLLPFFALASSLLPLEIPVPSPLTFVPSCYILQFQGLFLVSIALFATHPALHRVPRSHHRHVDTSHPLGGLARRLSTFAFVLAFAQTVANTSTHCPTSLRKLPVSTSTSTILASHKSTTGQIIVGEEEIRPPSGEGNGYRFRYLRADHSLLGGLWTGVSEMELKARRNEVNEAEIVRNAESIYSTFILQELVRLVKTPEDLPRQTPQQGLVIGLGAGLIARALDAHRVNLTICEIDPTVYDFARRYFGVPEPAEVVLRDAKSWLSEKSNHKTFDYIVHDVFTGGSVPSSLFTLELWSSIKDHLHHSGIVAVNFAGSLSSRASKLVLSTLLYSFPHCRAFEDNPSSLSSIASSNSTSRSSSYDNLVIFCSSSWFVPIDFRDPVETDFLDSPSPRLRRQVFDKFLQHEVSLDRFVIPKEGEEGGDTEWAKESRRKWILTDRNSRKLEGEQVEGAKEHWRTMQQVLSKETWARW